MKYLFILFTLLSFSERKLEIINEELSTRFGLSCLNDEYCLALEYDFTDDLFNVYNYNKQNENFLHSYSSDIFFYFDQGETFLYQFIDSNNVFILRDYLIRVYSAERDSVTISNTLESIDIFKRKIKNVKTFLMFDKYNGVIPFDNHIVKTYDAWLSYDTVSFDNIRQVEKVYKYNDSICYFLSQVKDTTKSDSIVWTNGISRFNILNNDLKIISTIPTDHFYFQGNSINNHLYFNKDTLLFFGNNDLEGPSKVDLIMKSIDQGKSWTTTYEKINVGNLFYDLEFNSNNSHGIISFGHQYLETYDKGDTWSIGSIDLFNPQDNRHNLRIEFLDDIIIIGSTLYQGIYKWEEVTSVNLEDIGKLKVWQSGSTFRVGSDINELQINIFDLQGNQVNTEHFNKNTIIDLSDRPTGTYLFNIIHQNLILKSGKLSVVN